MLSLRRKEGQSITIGEDVTVVVAKISPGKVTLHIAAPQTIQILRDDAKKIREPNGAEPDADRRFIEELRILAQQGHSTLVMRKLTQREAGAEPEPVDDFGFRPDGVLAKVIVRHRPRDPRDMSLDELRLDQRAVIAIEGALDWGLDDDGCPRMPTAGLLCRHTADDLLAIKSVGDTTVGDVRAALGKVGLKLRGD